VQCCDEAAAEAKTVPVFKNALKLICSALPEKAIRPNNSVKDYRKWLEATVNILNM